MQEIDNLMDRLSRYTAWSYHNNANKGVQGIATWTYGIDIQDNFFMGNSLYDCLIKAIEYYEKDQKA